MTTRPASEKSRSGLKLLREDVTSKVIARGLAGEERARALLATLSERELIVAKMMYQGMTVQQIGKKLFLSPSSISTYRLRVLRKLQLENNAQLIIFIHEMVVMKAVTADLYAASLHLPLP